MKVRQQILGPKSSTAPLYLLSRANEASSVSLERRAARATAVWWVTAAVPAPLVRAVSPVRTVVLVLLVPPVRPVCRVCSVAWGPPAAKAILGRPAKRVLPAFRAPTATRADRALAVLLATE